MGKFATEYGKLNKEQRQAVDTIDGPLLVIAGPGTGKTQLLSVRVANILRQPDIEPNNILCLTFTDNAARTMLERLETMVGQPAYHVSIHTFHSFGSDIINKYPDYFAKRALLQPVDELGSYELLRGVFDDLDHSNPLSARLGSEYVFLKNTKDIISWLKHNAVSPDELDSILNQNATFFDEANKLVGTVFTQTPSRDYMNDYQKLTEALAKLQKPSTILGYNDYASLCIAELRTAIDETAEGSGKRVPTITSWRNAWLEKDNNGQFIFKDSGRSQEKLSALQEIYATFQSRMASQGLYDFDDMVLEVVQALEQHEDLRLNLQERYQYILVDEFQDTNKAQLRILEALGNNPVNENKPNIMVVGDPNQAIYAFQGAESSNVTQFINKYDDVITIGLTDNYRSTQSVLDASLELIKQSSSQVSNTLELTAKSKQPIDVIEHNVLSSELAQYSWISDKIQGYLKSGIRPDKIAIIAPRHKYLERLMPYLITAKIPVAYERRENILDAPLITQLLKMVELVTALSEGKHNQADALFAEVLSFPFWNITDEDLIAISLECYDNNLHWLPVLIKYPNKDIQVITKWFFALSKTAKTQPMEYILDILTGNDVSVANNEDEDLEAKNTITKYISPFKKYYFGKKSLDTHTDDYLAHLGQLTTLRQHLRAWKPDIMLYVADLVEFVNLHRQAKLKIVDTNPHTQTTNAVQVMTAFKAKGLEFDIVFAVNAQDEVWGPKAKSQTNRIRLPKNLPIKPTGDSDDDKLRLFFVALTRAKHTLHITSYTHNLSNKLSLGLSFIGGNSTEATPIHAAFTPKHIGGETSSEAVQILSTDWMYRYRQVIADKPTLFEPILDRYKLSVTHLTNFLDAPNNGPQLFLLHNLLRFPSAMSAPAAYGDAIHKTLQWVYQELRSGGALPVKNLVVRYFTDMLSRKHLPPRDFSKYKKRGIAALELYLKERVASMTATDIIERGFGYEGVVINKAHLSGKIDKIILDKGTAKVIDFKTGKPSTSWQGKDDYEQQKLHRYKQQLMFYKLLIENSASYAKKTLVTQAALDFVEVDRDGVLQTLLELEFDPKELARFTKLITIVWQHISDLNFPDTSKYSKNLKGIQAFEEDLLTEKI